MTPFLPSEAPSDHAVESLVVSTVVDPEASPQLKLQALVEASARLFPDVPFRIDFGPGPYGTPPIR